MSAPRAAAAKALYRKFLTMLDIVPEGSLSGAERSQTFMLAEHSARLKRDK
ncbi:MAG: hypothetical protein AAGH57_01960 [Pseudomonadota bacterium]